MHNKMTRTEFDLSIVLPEYLIHSMQRCGVEFTMFRDCQRHRTGDDSKNGRF